MVKTCGIRIDIVYIGILGESKLCYYLRRLLGRTLRAGNESDDFSTSPPSPIDDVFTVMSLSINVIV